MAASSSSSSLPSENEKKEHPYQIYPNPGPTGAYEARQIKNSGFYVRVDMPGVPPDGVKLVKYAETQTVTFSGKASMLWPGYDSSDRVYGGYVVLDRDPNQIEIEMKVTNGSMRLFFRGSEGSLHFLSGLKRAPNVEDRGEDDSVVYTENDGCHSCHSMGNSVSPTIAFSHINPFLIQGVEGVHENRLVQDITRTEWMYIRMDMPGVAENQYEVGVTTLENKIDALLYGGEGKKEHRLEQGGRVYWGSFTLFCGCCKILDVRRQLSHSVLRVLLLKGEIQERLANKRTNRRRRR
ncbi:uncharacterized protein LOC141598791 [Silene latifolia]|uniref:uncharacterized protein LOC141598791 n=1 Tax=Silene latifolia TaxID=37657 RepID=UPI003D76F865